jgi:hypothetical protein
LLTPKLVTADDETEDDTEERGDPRDEDHGEHTESVRRLRITERVASRAQRLIVTRSASTGAHRGGG